MLLVHGGFFPQMTPAQFWGTPGVVADLEAQGHQVIAPDRASQPCTWVTEAEHLRSVADECFDSPAVVVAGSNGCSAAVRLAIEHPQVASALVLCWPATAGDPAADRLGASSMGRHGWSDEHIAELFRGDTLRGVTDTELAALEIPVAVIPSAPFNLTHQEQTVDRILNLVAGSYRTEAYPESPTSLFPARRSAFTEELANVIDTLVETPSESES